MSHKQKNDILQGTLTLLVLRMLQSQGPLHGYALTNHIQRISAELLRVEEGHYIPRSTGWSKPVSSSLIGA